eukprot:symbB.v1.2.042299.t1/scaffold9706.1/size2540/1
MQEMQINMHQQRIVEPEHLYNSRPSREEDTKMGARQHATWLPWSSGLEDLQFIAQLENDVREKSAQIMKLLDDMQFYELELASSKADVDDSSSSPTRWHSSSWEDAPESVPQDLSDDQSDDDSDVKTARSQKVKQLLDGG